MGWNIAIEGIITFIDGAFHVRTYLTHNQEVGYNGWKHLHGMKYQGVMTLDRLFIQVT